MSTVQVFEPQDTAKIIKDWLKEHLAEPFPELRVRLELSGGDDVKWTYGDAPVLVVFDDPGSTGRFPVATQSTTRLTTWTTGRELKYLHRAIGLLLCTRVPGIAKIRPGAAVIAGRDDDNNGDIASATVLTTARTTTVL